MEYVGPHVDAGHYLLVYQCFLEFIGLLVGFLYGEFFNLCQLAGETFVKSSWGCLSVCLNLGPHESCHVLGDALLPTTLAKQSSSKKLLELGIVHLGGIQAL